MENSNRRSDGASGSSDRPRRNSGSSKNSNRNSSRPNSRPDSRNSNPNRSERSDRPRSERPARDGEFKARRPRIEGKDGEFKPRRPRPEGKDGEKRSLSRSNNAAFKPRGERRGDRSLDNRKKDDRRPINRDFSKDPIIPEGITGEELDKVTRGDLLTLSAENAKIVSQHLACVNAYADSEPELAHEHAQAAVRHAGRVAVVRETAGYAAYRVGKYEIAIKDLKAAFRINGDVSIWPVLADCERGLGKPRKALELAGAPESKKLQKEQAIELRIVAAGARRDLGEFEAAVVTLQTNDLNTENDSWAVRLRYAYADALDAAGRKDEARKWFAKCAAIDVDEVTDASERS